MTRIRLGGGLPLRRARVDLATLCRGAIEEIETGDGDAAIELEVQGDAGGQWDADRLAQMLGNLIGNAASHRSGEGPVKVHIDGRAPDELTVAVQNHGVIPVDVLPHTFEPFRRGSARVERARGLGLGLCIAREVVAAHGGRTAVTSTEATGTTFAVVLPRGVETRAPRADVA